MTKPTDPPATRQTIAGLIAEAEGATEILPPYERCIELNRDLRAAIGDLYLAAHEQAQKQTPRSRDWYRIHNILEDADAALNGDLGTGLLSAALHIAELARQLRALTGCVPQPL